MSYEPTHTSKNDHSPARALGIDIHHGGHTIFENEDGDVWSDPTEDWLPIVAEPQGIVVVGNLVDGFTHIGPFINRWHAIDHAEREVDGDWVVAELVAP